MNNRQANNGRRRGRGGQQRQGGNPNQGNGNRIDNRARGNAAQLLEKYKNLASDAQRQGDRVNAEYYLQFADHYFRVLSETRSRFEEQNPNQRQPRPSNDIDGDDEDFEYEAEGNRGDDQRDDRQQQPQQREPRYEREPRQDREAREPRPDREFRPDREPRQDREPRENRDREGRRDRRPNGNAANGYANGHQPEAQETPAPELFAEQRDVGEERAPRPARGRGRPRRDEAEVEAPQGIDAAILPPAFGDASAANDADEAPKKPRRRRTVKSDDAEVPPAA
ncbi:DUF4167 domain-containing protein [Sphingomonas sp. Root241]|uniref:DUF4167 domain-containing protein n=1 Tax=Sphingomonas sp. Root241 TaxID=1736501 RepID=UPI0006F99930|nr:hypothetical protein ASE13_15320 [Sphingomonas sp. Root241]